MRSICAIHGLNGNAFQTWTAKTNSKMWLRDLLPSSKPFDNARIMTFGYSSQLADRANLSGISEWAHHLLVSMSGVRQSQKVCYQILGSAIMLCLKIEGENTANNIHLPFHGWNCSPSGQFCYTRMGSQLLAWALGRLTLTNGQAMIRLNEYSHKQEYQGISLKCCGLLFLSTPHSGATSADWNAFLVSIGRITFALRPEILKSLESFNPLSAEAQEDYVNMEHHPPFEAFYETQRTKIAKLNCHVYPS